MQLRTATPEDADAIAGIVFAVAHHAFSELEPRRVALLDLDELREEWARRLDPGRDRSAGEDVTVVAELGGTVVGAASWLLPRSPFDVEVTDGVLTHLVVHPAAQGAGVGSALLPYAEDALRAHRGGRPGQSARTRLHEGNWWAATFLVSRGWDRDPAGSTELAGSSGWSRTL